jgi:Mn2+/Fe2+ NRAMP family transporter
MIPGIPLFPIMWLSQSINAILLPVLLVLLLKLANDKELLGKWVNKKRQNYLTIFLTILITVITIGLFAIPLFK